MATKKKSKSVLTRIGDVATSAAEVVIDVSSKAMHAVGDMMPGGTSKKSRRRLPKKRPRPRRAWHRPMTESRTESL